MSFNFTPTDTDTSVKVPFFEDARADFAPYYSSRQDGWTIKRAQAAVSEEMGKLKGGVVAFREGVFSDKGQRYGYQIDFVMEGATGRLNIAGLPIRSNLTPKKIESVRIQALLNMRDWLKTAITSMVFSPGNNPLIPHLLGPGGRTMAEFIAERASLDMPLLVGEIVEG